MTPAEIIAKIPDKANALADEIIAEFGANIPEGIDKDDVVQFLVSGDITFFN